MARETFHLPSWPGRVGVFYISYHQEQFFALAQKRKLNRRRSFCLCCDTGASRSASQHHQLLDYSDRRSISACENSVGSGLYRLYRLYITNTKVESKKVVEIAASDNIASDGASADSGKMSACQYDVRKIQGGSVELEDTRRGRNP